MNDYWQRPLPLTPRQRDVQSAHRHGYVRGLRDGAIVACLSLFALLAIVVVWLNR